MGKSEGHNIAQITLMSTDSANAAAMDEYAKQHLAKLDPAFATMYNDRQFPETAHPTPPIMK